MSFLVLLLVLWVEKFSSLRQRIQQDGPGCASWPAFPATRAWPGAPGRSSACWWCCRWWSWPLMALQPLAYGWLALPTCWW